MGLVLPDELIGATFDYLDIPSLLRCMQVCKLFHSVISESIVLRYKIELFVSYMEDNAHSSMDAATRLDLLREYNRVWNHMEWPSSGLIPMLNGRCWEFSGGILAQSTVQNEVCFVQLPSKLKGIAERRWSVLLDFEIRDFTFDNSQDLLVLLELVGNLPDVSCRIHLQTLSGERHPRTVVQHITHPLESLHANFSFLMQISGDHIAILFYDLPDVLPQNFFVVWNWRTGHRKVDIRSPDFLSFSFMTEDLILAGVANSSTEPALRVLSIAACTNPIHSSKDMPYICELRYPVLLEGTEYFLIRSDPTPSWRPPSSFQVPFYCSRKDFIFTICVHHSSDEIHESTVLFVPLSTLLLEVERSRDEPRRNVAWKNWGPNGARMICREPSETWVCYTYGMKFVHGLRWDGQRIARAYDFNRYAAKKHVKSSADSLFKWKPLVESSKPSGRCEVFEEEVITTLPGRVVNFRLGQSDGGGWEAAMIGEDHILMVESGVRKYGYMAM